MKNYFCRYRVKNASYHLGDGISMGGPVDLHGDVVLVAESADRARLLCRGYAAMRHGTEHKIVVDPPREVPVVY